MTHDPSLPAAAVGRRRTESAVAFPPMVLPSAIASPAASPGGTNAATNALALQQGNPHLSVHDANILTTYASALDNQPARV